MQCQAFLPGLEHAGLQLTTGSVSILVMSVIWQPVSRVSGLGAANAQGKPACDVCRAYPTKSQCLQAEATESVIKPTHQPALMQGNIARDAAVLRMT